MNERDPARADKLQVDATLSIRFDDPQACERAKAVLEPESHDFLTLETEADRLHITVPAGAVGRVLATLDDTLACLQAASGAEDRAAQTRSKRSQKNGEK